MPTHTGSTAASSPEASPDDIRAMQVVATIVDGIVVYCSDGDVCRSD
jgi:hypothetical protein